ncbi:hypothetical protein B9Z19DRAFT_1128596 [Tuber borchii]|uniref:Uncharacterized protein n=1 Tax=Tuber borchii TaxID=42251 RepID=A0A2T6ZNY9_TUBBO|nr:hypothetical protein B9Z19DRAFT_1128596 [Tuber borchii]
MQSSNDDNGWGDLLPSLEETLELLPELRETAEALGNLRTDPNLNDPKSSGHQGPPTSRAIEPVRNTLYDPASPKGPTRRGLRSKLDLAGLYTPPRPRNTAIASEDKRSPPLPTTPHSNRVPPKKGSYRAAIAKARLFKTEKEQQLQFTPTNEPDSDPEFEHRIVKSTALDSQEKICLLHRGELGAPEAFTSAQPAEINSNVDPFSLVENSQPVHVPPLVEKKRGYMGRAAYLSATDSSESADDTEERSYGAKLSIPCKGNLPQRKTTAGRSASPGTEQKDISYHEESVPLSTPEVTTGSSRPRRRAAAVAMERARTQIDDPFPGLFAPRRVNRRTTEQKALTSKLTRKEPVVKMEEPSSASEDYKIVRPRIPVPKTQLFYKMESIDPDE